MTATGVTCVTVAVVEEELVTINLSDSPCWVTDGIVGVGVSCDTSDCNQVTIGQAMRG